MNVSLEPSTSGRLEPWLAGAGLVVLLATFLFFVSDTRMIRVACSDDAFNQRMARDGSIAAHFVQCAHNQGRFYQAVPGHVLPYNLYRIDSPWLFSAVRAALFFCSIGLVGWLCARVTANAALGWMTALFGVAALHLPATFFAVLSFPTMMLGFCALLGSLHLHLAQLRRDAPLAALFSGVLLVVACESLEVFVTFLPVFAALSWRAGRRSARSLGRSLVAPLTAVIGYVVVYFAFRAAYPSGYDGTQVASGASAALNVLVRMTLSVVPPYELFAHRTHPPGSGPLFKSAAEVTALLASVNLKSWALILAQGAVFAAMALRAARRKAAIGGRAVMIAFACMALPNFPISVAAKYQIWVHQRGYPYIYSFYSYCCLAFGAVCLAHWVATRVNAGRHARRWMAGFSVGCGLLFFSAQASNAETLRLLQRWYNESPTMTPTAAR